MNPARYESEPEQVEISLIEFADWVPIEEIPNNRKGYLEDAQAYLNILIQPHHIIKFSVNELATRIKALKDAENLYDQDT